jgi:hypothetical protein
MKAPILTPLLCGLALSLGGAALAQDAPHPAAELRAAQNPAVKSTNDMIDAPLAAGNNSFTMTQARSRIRSAGYTHVTHMTQDASGLWQGRARKHGRTVHVALDYKGNVASN